jgi:hypothetical protein
MVDCQLGAPLRENEVLFIDTPCVRNKKFSIRSFGSSTVFVREEAFELVNSKEFYEFIHLV